MHPSRFYMIHGWFSWFQSWRLRLTQTLPLTNIPLPYPKVCFLLVCWGLFCFDLMLFGYSLVFDFLISFLTPNEINFPKIQAPLTLIILCPSC